MIYQNFANESTSGSAHERGVQDTLIYYVLVSTPIIIDYVSDNWNFLIL